MNALKQTDPRWALHKLGTCTDTIGQSGCFITVLSMLANLTPLEVNDLMVQRGGYAQGCLIIPTKAAEILGLANEGTSPTPKKVPCIAWTRYYQNIGVPQHFFVWLGNNQILDPITGTQKANPYPIVEYINIYPKEASQPNQLPMKYIEVYRTSNMPDVNAIVHLENDSEVAVATSTAGPVKVIDPATLFKQNGNDTVFMKLHIPTFDFAKHFGSDGSVQQFNSIDLAALNANAGTIPADKLKRILAIINE